MVVLEVMIELLAQLGGVKETPNESLMQTKLTQHEISNQIPQQDSRDAEFD